MNKSYKHLSLVEREKVYALKEQGLSFRAIGKKLFRDHRTIAREYKRNRRAGEIYIPCNAHERYQKRAQDQRRKAPLKNHEVYLYVREKLRSEQWSPEEIAGRLSVDLPNEKICHETIYSYIHGRAKREKLWRYLTHSRKRRRVRSGRRVKKDKKHSRIPGAISIDKRSIKANKRTQIGHVETDLMEGKKKHKTVLSVDVWRKTRYTQLTKLNNKKAQTKGKSLQKKLNMIKSLSKSNKPIVRSVTSDNGSENANHKEISNTLNIKYYYCHPYHSWEKGTVENTIGRIRRYIPKGSELHTLTNTQIQWLENKLNNTPRKCLNYLTPNEVMEKEANTYKFRRFKRRKEKLGGALQLRM